MEPKINFVWSFVYQSDVHSVFIKTESYDYKKYEKFVLEFIKQLKKEWAKYERAILSYIEELTGLKWKKAEIDCYVIKISPFYSISQPLTIPIQVEVGTEVYTLSLDRYVDMLIHEIIHVLFVQNYKETDRYFDHLLKGEYKGEKFNATIHIPVHAIHKKIFLKFFDEKRLKQEIEACKYYPDYYRSWEIVEKIGSDKIIKDLTELTIVTELNN